MSPPRTEDEISAIMRKVHSAGTTPEVAFRQALQDAGVDVPPPPSDLPGKPDFVFPSRRLVVFIDGDYWHGNQWRIRGLTSLEDQFTKSAPTSREYWLKKIRRNMQRDSVTTTKLLAEGWTVLRFWESDIRKRLGDCVALTVSSVTNGAQPSLFSRLPEKTFAEFFAGVGLVRMGLERQGWSIEFANDIDTQKYAMYRGQFPDAEQHFVVEDIHKLSTSQIPSVTLATASFPCNDLSLAGARQGLRGSQSSAFWGFVQLLDALGERRPPLVLIENVTGFLTSHQGEDFKQAMLALNRLGYAVDPFIIDAARFVPQSRPRLFVVAIQRGLIETDRRAAPPQADPSELRPATLTNFIRRRPEIDWHMRALPALPQREQQLEAILDPPSAEGTEWWSHERAEYLLNQMSPRHRAVAQRMIDGDGWSYGTVFRRVRHGQSMAELRTDGLAGCLRTPRGGSGRQILFKAGQGQYLARLLSPTECARLMGADDFKVTVGLNQALFGFGDAVCAPVIAWIALYYLNPLVNELIRGRPLVATV